MPPETLADVKKGDTVTVFPGAGGFRPSTVKRVTKWQIILEGDDHYNRTDGLIKSDGYQWSRSAQIAVGAKAVGLKAKRRMEKIRIEAAHGLGVPVEQLNQATVIVHRAACDRAEAALRELGEWSE